MPEREASAAQPHPVQLVLPEWEGGEEALRRVRERFRPAGEILAFPGPAGGEDELARRVAGAEVALSWLGGTRLSSGVLDRAPGLRLVCVVGPWTDRIDLDAAGRLGICVTNTPGAAVPAVAEMTLALMLALLRPIPTLPPVASPDGWRPPLGRELCGKHLGLLGLGAIGSAVARLARALGMTVSAWSPALTPERAEAHGARARPLPEILEEADVVSLHLRWGARTARVLDREAIGRLQRTAVLVNTSRAALVDEDALYEALSQRRIAGAALDVHGREPLPEDSRWRRLPNVLLTPHCAWSTGEAVDRMVEMAAGNALAFLRGAPRHVVKAA